MSFKLRIKMPRFIFMWFLSVIAYSCSSTNSAEAITNEYLAILEKATHSPKEAKKELWNLINVGDRNYLQEVSEVYASKNDSIWMKYLKSSMHKEIESQWFNASLEKGIRDTSEFLDYVLIDLMSFDRGLFKEAEHYKTEEVDPTITKVIYSIHIASKYNIARQLSVFTYKGQSSLLLVPTITRYNENFQKSIEFKILDSGGGCIANVVASLKPK